MRQIRRNVFETNSSSCHSLVVATKDKMDDWRNGEFYWSRWGCAGIPGYEDGGMIPAQLIKDKFMNEFESEKADDYEEFDYWLDYNYGICNYDNWCEELEQDFTTYTTPSGDVINIRCAYGRDG